VAAASSKTGDSGGSSRYKVQPRPALGKMATDVHQWTYCGKSFIHWECAGINSDSAILPWYCNSCVQAKVIKKQEETILSLSRELELAKIEISLLKRELNLVDNCHEEFRTVSNSRRKLKNVPS
jgi:hypothetical protein